MKSPSTSSSLPNKRPKLNLTPPQRSLINLTHDIPSSQAPNAPIDTPSIKGTSSSSSRPNSSPFTSFVKNSSLLFTQSGSGTCTPFVSDSSCSINTSNSPSPPITSSSQLPNLLGNLSPPPRISHPPPPNTSLTLSPNGHLENNLTTPPSSLILNHSIPYNFVNNHTIRCACCYHNFHLISSLRDDLHYMFGYLEYLLSQQNSQLNPISTMPPSVPPSPSPSN